MLSTYAIGFFIAAACLGAIVLTAVLRNKPTPKPIAILHGTLAIIGIVLLATFVAMGNHSYLLIASLVVFTMAALGGLTMFRIDMSKKPIPRAFALGHPVLAITGVILLIIYWLQ